MKISEDDIVVRLMDCPVSIRGFVLPSPDGAYNIYLNARQSFEMQRMAFLHEIRHITNDDFRSDKPVVELEGRNKLPKIDI